MIKISIYDKKNNSFKWKTVRGNMRGDQSRYRPVIRTNKDFAGNDEQRHVSKIQTFQLPH